ncbi:MAG TPA: hypothetical protein VLC98_16730 [Phnomibacter sp.]|nr:hypothetical protein [Phnomibacter sp.]
MDKRTRLNAIAQCCETRFNRGPANDWKIGDFTELGRAIFRETGVSISINTLKRIFGKIAVEEDYLPQQATLDALIQYGGYQIGDELTVTPLPHVRPAVPVGVKPTNQPTRFKWWMAVVVLVLIAGGIGLVQYLSTTSQLKGSITLKNTSGVLPATAFFQLELPETKDSLFINFGDKSAYAKLTPGQTSISHIYLFPGVFPVALQIKGQVIDTATVFVRSNKWMGFGYHRQADLPDRYYAFPAQKNADSLFTISHKQLFSSGVDTTGSLFTRLCNFTDVAASADNFELEASFKNDVEEKGMYCNSTQLQVSGAKGMIRFKLVSPGCSSSVLNVVGENRYEGSTSDLSGFSINLEQWNRVKMVNRNKHITFWVNDKKLFEGAYTQSLGDIKGLFLEFGGTGFVKTLQLGDSNRIFYRF